MMLDDQLQAGLFGPLDIAGGDPNTTSWDPKEFTYQEFRRNVLALFPDEPTAKP